MLLLLHLFCLFLLVFLGFYAFVADPRSRANQTFAAFISFLALWTVKDLIFWNFPETQTPADWWVAISFITSLLMQTALVVFSVVFPDKYERGYRMALIAFAPSLVMIPAAALGLLWNRVSVSQGVLDIDLAPLAYFFVSYVYAVFGLGAFLLFQKYRNRQPGLERQQIGAVILALLITAVLKTLANIILPFFGNYYLLPYSAVLVIPGVLIYSYAISSFKLFSIQTALDQFRLFPVTYKVALSIATVAVISFLAFQVPIVWWAFSDGNGFEAWRRYLTFSVLSALVPNLLLVLLVVRSISRPLQRIAVAAIKVRDGNYGAEVDLRQTNDEIGIVADSFNSMSRKMAADIKKLQELNEQLVRTEKLAAMGTLAAGVAHEVNNPLASISSLIQMMQKSDSHSDADREKLDLILSQIERIKSVTGDMLEFGRVRSAARQQVSLNELVMRAVRLASFDKTFKRLDLTLDLDEALPEIEVDSDQIQQVVLNLLLNAKDALPQGGEVRVTTNGTDQDQVLEIADNGVGIKGEDLKSIFDPFYSTKSQGVGTGLGLAVCYGIVTAHGGTIEVESKPASDTRFTVTLPTTPST